MRWLVNNVKGKKKSNGECNKEKAKFRADNLSQIKETMVDGDEQGILLLVAQHLQVVVLLTCLLA